MLAATRTMDAFVKDDEATIKQGNASTSRNSNSNISSGSELELVAEESVATNVADSNDVEIEMILRLTIIVQTQVR